jgi:osmotically-inducible protein OsmY
MAHQQKGENIMLNLNRILKSLAGVALLLTFMLTFMGCASTRTSEGTGEYVDDSTITTKVKSAILMDSSLKVLQINVETFKGEVQLSGFVDTRANSSKAGEVARSIKGVSSVKNNLIVK